MQDFAHATADSATGFANRTSVRKYFYFDRGVNYLLAGVPLSWLDEQPSGDVVIDPTTSVGANKDVWIEDAYNKNAGDNSKKLKVGKNEWAWEDKKRTLLQFDVSGIPGTATIINAQLQLYYYQATGSTWVDRWVHPVRYRHSYQM